MFIQQNIKNTENMLCYSGKNTQSFQAAFYTISGLKPPSCNLQPIVPQLCITQAGSRDRGDQVKLIYSMEYKVHKKNKCIEMNQPLL